MFTSRFWFLTRSAWMLYSSEWPASWSATLHADNEAATNAAASRATGRAFLAAIPHSPAVRLSHRGVEGAAVEQQVLADDEPRGGGAEKGAGVTKLGRVADAARR